MRIAFFTDSFLPEKNGVAISLGHIAQYLGLLGHDVLVIAPQEAERTRKEREWPGVQVLRLPSVTAPLYADFRFIYRGKSISRAALQIFRPQVIHVHSIFSAGWIGRALAREFHVPLIGTNHIYLTRDNTDFYACISSHVWIAKPLSNILFPFSYRFHASYDVCISPSQSLMQGMRQSGYQKPIVVVPNPILAPRAMQLSPPQKEAQKAALGLRGKVVLHFGRLSFEKSVDVVIEAFARVVREGMDASLLIIGDGPARVSLEALAQSLGVSERVRFHGFLEHDALLSSPLPGLCDLFVTASATESQGMAVIEAMGFGLPVVAVRAGAVPEMVGDAAILVPKGQIIDMAAAMRRVLQDDALSSSMRSRSLQRSALFTPEKTVEALLEVYKSLLT